MYLSTRLLRTLALLAILLSAINRLMAQDVNENNFTRYTKQDGLSHNIITGMVQDSTGYIWIATPAGLNRFSGSSFVQIHSCADSLSLPAENIRGLVWLDNHRLAAYSVGLHIIDTRSGKIRNLFIPYADKNFEYKFNGITSVKSSPAGELFLLTQSGFYHYDKDYQLIFRFDYYPKEELASAFFAFGREILWLDQNRLAIISIAGIYCYTISTREFRKMAATDCPQLSEFLAYPKIGYEFFQTRPGSFYIMGPEKDSITYVDPAEKKRTSSPLPFPAAKSEFDYRSELVAVSDTLLYITGRLSGFYKMRLFPETGKIIFYPRKYFPLYYCHHLLEDRDNNLWIGTNQGLFRQDYGRSFTEQAPIPASLRASFPNIVIDDIHSTGNKLYVATRGDGGLLVFDKERLQFINRIGFRKYSKPYTNANSDNDNVYSIVSKNDSTLLIGTNGPLFQLNTVTGKKSEIALDKWDVGKDWIADLFKDRNDNIWIASSENVYKYNAATGKYILISTGPEPFNRIQEADHIIEDASGNIWIAGHGLFRYNTAIGRFDRVVDTFPYIKMPDRRVNSFIADHSNNLWISSYNNGLCCYNLDSGLVRHFTRDSGLPDDNIAAMILIGKKLWLATLSGIACLDLQTYQITNFGIEDGFPDLPITNGAKFSYDIGRNKLYIGFSNTIVQFDPDIIFKKKPLPHLFIENLTVGDRKEFVYPGKDIATSWKNNEITVSIGSINFFTNTNQRFSYRLVKEDSTNWQNLGAQNTFSISGLTPGHHRIQVRLSSVNNLWPDQIEEIGINVLPPFWKETWFIIFLMMLLTLSVYLLLKWRIGLTEKREQAKTHIAQLEAEEYKNQFELEQISNYFSSSLANKKNVEDVLWDVSKNLIGRMNYVDCMIYMWNENKTKMVQKASYGPKGTPKAIIEQTFDVLPGQGIVGHVTQTREALLVPNTREDRRYRMDDILRLSEICVPIIHNNELIGIIDAEHPVENFFRERDLQILITIATLVGNKIKQIESEQSLEIKQKEIALINQQLAEAQLSALQTQMNPHFIFNSLNSIKGMILENEQQKASRYLSKFAHMIRTTLDQSKETFTTLFENIEHLESYLLMEKLRFDDSFTFRITVDGEIDREEVLIPTLMIQPLAENAIWHGLLNKKGEKKLSIRFARQTETISCIITDNGIGIKQSQQLKQVNNPPHRSVGLNNLRNRIKIMNEKFHTGCTLDITDLKDHYKDKTGTRVILCFNIITNKPNL